VPQGDRHTFACRARSGRGLSPLRGRRSWPGPRARSRSGPSCAGNGGRGVAGASIGEATWRPEASRSAEAGGTFAPGLGAVHGDRSRAGRAPSRPRDPARRGPLPSARAGGGAHRGPAPGGAMLRRRPARRGRAAGPSWHSAGGPNRSRGERGVGVELGGPRTEAPHLEAARFGGIALTREFSHRSE